ncbi:secreted RxLR effector protein 161-like [Malania oleifera]|uniref:secreted RxLR effector protein 161-like n=1 Tax=Malania oleifera TaxID=397392 RepID=UPI0025AE53AA|nr:secreted RxLR effector protein 161-like [Malania oleifera]
MTECTPVVTPMEVNIKFSIEDPSPLVDTKRYKSLIGSLVHLCNTRPDISFAVGILSRFANKSREIHQKSGMRVLKYIKGTPHFGISYTLGNFLIGYCDSNWAEDIDSRKLVPGYCFLFMNGIISWTSKKQPTMSLSSTKAKYKSAYHTSCEAVWIRRLFTDIGIMINVDEVVEMEYSPTEDNHGDIFTKALGSSDFQKHQDALGIGSRV